MQSSGCLRTLRRQGYRAAGPHLKFEVSVLSSCFYRFRGGRVRLCTPVKPLTANS
jgi:hypothetical protein